MQVITIGLDLAKHWFQVHGVDADAIAFAGTAMFQLRVMLKGRAAPRV